MSDYLKAPNLEAFLDQLSSSHQYLNHDIPIEQQEVHLQQSLDSIWTLLSFLMPSPSRDDFTISLQPKSNKLIDAGLITEQSQKYIDRIQQEGGEDTNKISITQRVDEQGHPYYEIVEIYKDIHEDMTRAIKDGKAPEKIRFDAYRAEKTTIRKSDDGTYHCQTSDYHNPNIEPPFDTLVIPHIHIGKRFRLPTQSDQIETILNHDYFIPNPSIKPRSINTTVALLIESCGMTFNRDRALLKQKEISSPRYGAPPD